MTVQHRADKVGKIKSVEDLTSTLSKYLKEILNDSKI